MVNYINARLNSVVLLSLTFGELINGEILLSDIYYQYHC